MAILAAVGEKQRSEDVVTVAADLATTYDEPLVVLHVVPTDDFESHRESLRNVPEFQGFSLTQESDSAAQFAREVVGSTLDDVDWDRIETRGRVGDPADEILAEAESVDPRYLVIGGRRQSPVGKALFGDVTQTVLLNADCPVVTAIDD